MDEFKTNLKKYQDIINKEMLKQINKNDVPEKKLNEAMEYSLMAGGKRLRPTLVLATYELFKDDYENCMPYAIALELIHNFSLIHDDLPEVDNDDFRHGKPTNHKQYGHATALLAGDGLLNQAYLIISEDLVQKQEAEDIGNRIKVFNEFSIAISKMINGEYLDTELEGCEITEELLKYIHVNKTGALISLAVRMGAIIGGASEIQIKKLTNYSEKIGLAFQIKDDILSVEGNEKITGKPVGNDKEKGKCTYVSKYGLDNSKQILDETVNEAITNLSEFGEKADFLKQLALYIKNRNK